MAVALPALGILARQLSNSDFSVLLLIWALIGYAGILDLGLSRAIVLETVKLRRDPVAQNRMFATVLFFATLSGVAGALIIWAGAHWLTGFVLRVEGDASAHVMQAVVASGWALPFLLPYLMIQGYLDGCEDFLESNLLRAFSGALPLLFAAATAMAVHSLEMAVWGIVAGRALSLLLAVGRKGHWRLLRRTAIMPSLLPPMLNYGGWVSVSGVISPLMGYLDRFILGFARGPEIVAFYAAPAEALYKMLVIPVAVARSLFPKIADRELEMTRQNLDSSYAMIGITSIPIAILLMISAPYLLNVWLGPRFSIESSDALGILAVGFVFSAFAQVPYTRLQAIGRPKWTALLHVVELAPFVLGAYALARCYGVAGIAAAWTLRNLVDLVALTILARIPIDR